MNELVHYGIARRSGRYPWGSGEESYQRTEDFIARVDGLKKNGMTEKEIAQVFNLTTGQLRIQTSWAKQERRADQVARATALEAKGMSRPQIAKEMGLPGESSVRSLLDKRSIQKMDEASNVANFLMDTVEKKGMVEVGAGVEKELGVSKEKMQQALYMLEMEGYPHYSGGVDQVNSTGRRTTITVLCPRGTEHKEIYNYDKVSTIKDYNTETGEANVRKFQYPTSVDGKRVHIRYAEEGGINYDGTIEIRRGVKDLDLGGSNYSQVRILVDNKSYLKGMAVYKDDSNFPEGTDIVFNTNKKKGTPPEKVFKPIKEGQTNPFGSLIKADGQSEYTDKDGKKKLSAINKRADEGDWNDWAQGLPHQFLAKQSRSLIKQQLNKSKQDRQDEYDSIMQIDNPTVRKHFLQSFADGADAAAVNLKAAAMPRQKYQVILPFSTLKDTECYAPNFKDGEQVALIRFPHGGRFEIPIVTVNNKNKEAIDTIGKNPKDAIGLNSKVAEQLSGADFDGDTVLAIPNIGGAIKNMKPLEDLKGFDNKAEYPAREGMKYLTKENVGREMGIISNLITDMTLKGASADKLARAVKHSMVVIDAEKHKLDYKKSEKDNGIAALKKEFQTTIDSNGDMIGRPGGASTLLSRAKGVEYIDKRIGTPKINIKGKDWYDPKKPEGALIYNEVEDRYVDANGKEKVRKFKSTKMYEIADAHGLSSGTAQEAYYADYANHMKAMANKARKELVITPKLQYHPEAKKQYQPEYDSLKAKLDLALMNAPRERQAQLYANSVIKAMKEDNPLLKEDKEQLKKLSTSALADARGMFGAERQNIKISDKEWEAIQAGAITENLLTKIMRYSDADILREKATPSNKVSLSEGKLSKLRIMKASGYTNAQIAEALGVSSKVVAKYA